MAKKRADLAVLFIENGVSSVQEIVHDANMVPNNIEIVFLPIEFGILRKKINNILDQMFTRYPSMESICEISEAEADVDNEAYAEAM